MDYEHLFKTRLDGLRAEGRYRVFADLERRAGIFPRAFHHRLGCGGDGVVLQRLSRHGPAPDGAERDAQAIDKAGAGAGGTRNISGTTHYHVELERELAELHGKEAALLFTSGYVANETALATLARHAPGLHRLFRCASITPR